jgi:hypothetical protein
LTYPGCCTRTDDQARAITAGDLDRLTRLRAASRSFGRRLDPGGFVGPVQQARNVTFPVDGLSRPQAEQVKEVLVVMLVFDLAVLIRPEGDHLEEGLVAAPAEQHVAGASGLPRLKGDLCPGVHADRGQAGLGQCVQQPVRAQVAPGVAGDGSKPADGSANQSLEAGPPPDRLNVKSRAPSRCQGQKRRIAPQNRDSCPGRAWLDRTAQLPRAEEAG